MPPSVDPDPHPDAERAAAGFSARFPWSAAVPAGRAAALARFSELLATAPLNLVSRGDRSLVDLHVHECVAVAAHLGLRPGAAWIDVGTGGGLPGVVLAILHPSVEWTLLDATRKKVDAVADMVRTLGLRNVQTVWGRAEELAGDHRHRRRYDGAVARAVAPLERLVPLLEPFLRPRGLGVAVKGPAAPQEVQSAASVLARSRLQPQIVPVPTAPRPTTLVMLRGS